MINKLLLNGVFIASVLVLRWLVLRLYKTRKQIERNDNFIVGINTISLIILVILLFLTFLQLINIEVRQFFTSISIIAAAIAILSKDYFSNAINGMILMFNSYIAIGDYVKIGDQKGKISHLSLMNVHLLNEEGDLILIPNNVVLSTQIVNYTKGETRKAQLELPLPPSMVEDLEKTKQIFKEAVSDFKHRASLNSLAVRIVDVQKDSVVVKISMLLHESDWQLEKEIHRNWISKWALIKHQLED